MQTVNTYSYVEFESSLMSPDRVGFIFVRACRQMASRFVRARSNLSRSSRSQCRRDEVHPPTIGARHCGAAGMVSGMRGPACGVGATRAVDRPVPTVALRRSRTFPRHLIVIDRQCR
jgi:hypothetical protein